MRFRFSIAVFVLIVAAPLFAADYVLMSSRWDHARTEAVNAAGGAVTFAHGPTGIALATSDDPAFAGRVSNTFQVVAPDTKMRRNSRSQEVDVEIAAGAVTPENETFVNVQWQPRAVNAQGAWSAGYTGRGVRIALLDGGIHATHIDLRNNIDVARSKSFVPGEPFNSDVGTFWHGTHTAGVIAGADNNIGMIGIAPEATLIGVKVTHDEVFEIGWIIAGILYAADPIDEGGAGADIISVGLDSSVDPNTGAGHMIAVMARAVDYATRRGALVVASIGADAYDLGQLPDEVHEEDGHHVEIPDSRHYIPGESGNALAVAATGPVGYGFGETNFRRFSSYSNWGEGAVWVAAPGGDYMLSEEPIGQQFCSFPRVPSGITTQRCWVFDMVLSSTRGSGASVGTYSYGAGPQLAVGSVAAVAALAKQAHPNATPAQLKTILARSADDEGRVGVDELYGHGFVNAGKAVQ